MEYNNLHAFFKSFINQSFMEVDDIYDTIGSFEWQLIPLAIINQKLSSNVAKNIDSYAAKNVRESKGYIRDIKEKAIELNIPLKAELWDLINKDSFSLAEVAENERYGELDRRTHPDIYMNELIENLRFVKKALYAIAKKIDLDLNDI